MPKPIPQATIRPSASGFALIGINGAVIRDGFKTRALAAMWAARKGLYQRTTPRPNKPTIPAELENDAIKGIPLLARLTGTAYWRFLAEAKCGLYGPLIQLGPNSFGLRFGDWKAAIASREIKTASK